MTDNDPFGGLGDFDKTVVRPGAGARAYPSPGSPVDLGPAPAHETTVMAALTATGTNRLAAAAAPLLALAARLRDAPAQRDVEGLRQRVVTELQAFEARARGAGVPPDQLRAAHYALSATIDDLVLNTPWGSESGWPRQSMVGTFHADVAGGDRFYDLLHHLHKDPGRNGDVLELMYLCLSLGFQGRMRVLPNGASEHARIRDGLYRTIRQRRGEFERELSPHWRGVPAVHRPIASHLPPWVVGLAAAVVALAVYMGFAYTLNRRSDAVQIAMAQLPPHGPVGIIVDRPKPPTPSPSQAGALGRLRAFLAPEIAEGLVEVTQSGGSAMVRITGVGLFAPGSATVQDRYRPLLERIGAALRDEPGLVTIVGHTDGTAIRSVRFPSNWHLSKARAEAVGDIVAVQLGRSDRLKALGRGEAEPIADNTTAEGRERNRRIEFILSQGGTSAS